ncbi:hypothetical protein HAX54_025635 [Datura stramonium]|uniref:Uncharacterized protein n=1 Tax=Datura stramonium TaxID=4076 RepID=A0ABS8V2E3_DATST|nr:hypothetical protein [Datura stramonium]
MLIHPPVHETSHYVATRARLVCGIVGPFVAPLFSYLHQQQIHGSIFRFLAAATLLYFGLFMGRPVPRDPNASSSSCSKPDIVSLSFKVYKPYPLIYPAAHGHHLHLIKSRLITGRKPIDGFLKLAPTFT